MRKSASVLRYLCRLITLLLILHVYLVDASQISKPYTDLGLHDIILPSNSKEPSVRRRYFFQSRCSGMFVRIKIGSKRNAIDASGKFNGSYTSIIMESIGMNGRVRLKGEESRKYLCFSKKGKLRARDHPTETCNFIYNKTTTGYYQFRLEANEIWYIGFKKKRLRNSIRGKALPGYKKNRGRRFKGCFDFSLKPVDQAKPTEKPFTPFNFNDLSDSWDPEKPFHPIRHMKKYQHLIRHRKMQRRRKARKRNRKSKKRKTTGS